MSDDDDDDDDGDTEGGNSLISIDSGMSDDDDDDADDDDTEEENSLISIDSGVDSTGLYYTAYSGKRSVEEVLPDVEPVADCGVRVIAETIHRLLPIIAFARQRLQQFPESWASGMDIVYDHFMTRDVIVTTTYGAPLEVKVEDGEGLVFDQFIEYLNSPEAVNDCIEYHGKGLWLERESDNDEYLTCICGGGREWTEDDYDHRDECIAKLDQITQFRIVRVN